MTEPAIRTPFGAGGKIKLSKPQSRIVRSKKRFKVAVCGRRFGKTMGVAIPEIARVVLKGPKRRAVYVAPTLDQARDTAWDTFKEVFGPYARKIREDRMEIRLKNGSLIRLRGAEAIERLRGQSLDIVVLDECADIDLETAWNEVLRPALSDRLGIGIFIGTPKGRNAFYRMWASAQTPEKEAEWGAFQYTTLDGGNVPASEVEAAKRDLDPRQFKQEYEASFETLEGRIYYGFDRKHNVAPVDDNGTDLLVGMDFNVAALWSVVGQKVGDSLHVLDEVVIKFDASTESMAEELKRRYTGDRPTAAWLKDGKGRHRLYVYPDASGGNRSTASTKTNFDILRQHGFGLRHPNANPAVVDRINTVNRLILAADGVRRLIVHPRCTGLIDALEGHTYKEGTSDPDKKSGLDHPNDALGYLICEEFPITAKGYSRVAVIGA